MEHEATVFYVTQESKPLTNKNRQVDTTGDAGAGEVFGAAEVGQRTRRGWARLLRRRQEAQEEQEPHVEARPVGVLQKVEAELHIGALVSR